MYVSIIYLKNDNSIMRAEEPGPDTLETGFTSHTYIQMPLWLHQAKLGR